MVDIGDKPHEIGDHEHHITQHAGGPAVIGKLGK